MIYGKDGTILNYAFAKDGSNLTSAYNKDGQEVWRSGRSHLVSANFTDTLLYDIPAIGGGTQGIACDSLSQEIAQLYTGKVITINLSDGSYTQRASTRNLGHGSAGSFAKEKINSSDLYPPLYVSTGQTQTFNDVTYGQYIELYVGESQSTINRAFFVPLNPGGYSLFAFDFDNDIVYSVVLKGYDSTEEGWGYISSYDMNDITEFTDGTYYMTPANGCWQLGEPIDTFVIDYVAKTQSIAFFDGLVAFLSDKGKVVFYDVETKSEYLTITDGIISYEREGIGFIDNPLTGQTDMILSARQTGWNKYIRYEFIL